MTLEIVGTISAIVRSAIYVSGRSPLIRLNVTVIYIDQPIGTGFSFGTDEVDSTLSASPFVWQAFQVLFESGEFSKFQSREYGLVLSIEPD